MSNNRSIGMDLTQGSIIRQMMAYALPMMAATALQQVYSMVDMVVMGQFVGSAGLSAVSIGSQSITLMTCLGIGFSTGAQILIAQHVGAKKRDALNGIIGTTFSVLVIAAIFATLLSLALHRPLLNMLSTPEESYAGAVQYLLIGSCGLIFIFGYNMVSAVLRGMGDSRRPLVFIAISSVSNIILDLLFIGAFKWDAAGAALATILSQGISFGCALVYLYRQRERFGFDFKLKSLKIQMDFLKKLLRLGIPSAIQMAALSISFLFISANINSYGVIASAAFGVGQKIEHVPSIAARGFSASVGAMVGQNFGAKKFDRIRKTTQVALLISGITYAVFAILYFLIPRPLFGLFTSEQAVLDMAKQILWPMMLAYPFNVLMNAYAGVVSGVGNANLSLVSGMLDGVVLRIGLAYLFGTVCNLGLVGFVMGYSMAASGIGIPSAIYYWNGMWKRRKSLVAEEAAE